MLARKSIARKLIQSEEDIVLPIDGQSRIQVEIDPVLNVAEVEVISSAAISFRSWNQAFMCSA